MITSAFCARMAPTNLPTASSMGAWLNDSGWWFGSVSTMPESRYPSMTTSSKPMISADLANSPGRSSARRCFSSSGVRPWNGCPGSRSAGFCRSPSSPPVQHTRTVCTPCALYIATVGAPFDASSSGWACTVSRQRRSFTTVNDIHGSCNVGSPVVRRLVAIPISLAALSLLASGCRHDGRTLRPALPSQNGSVSTTAASTVPDTEDDFFTTEAGAAGAPGGPIEVSTTNTGVTIATAAAALAVTAPWRDGAGIDPRYPCKGDNVAPALSWSPAPAGTQEIAVTMIDEDADFDHWTLAGIKPDVTSLAENTPPEGAVAALNGSGKAGYTGPCPPSGTHTYRITVYYLDSALQLAAGDPTDAMRTAIDDVTLATAEVSGTFSS